ncbi:MAG: nuclear transport factor 2 family protein [Solirubrobacterales bacterium]|nr:nuclear transport factor 2 family protein [Solirubrobacterales bacterium]
MKSDGFRAAAEAKDFESGRELFAEDVVFRSPFVHTPYEGVDALGFLLGHVVQVFENFRYVAHVEAGDVAVLQFEANVGDKELQGVDILKFDDEDKISEMTVMIRPASGLEAVGGEMGRRIEAATAS